MTGRPIITPDQLDFSTPGRRDYHVGMEHPTVWGRFLIPVTIIVGKRATEGKGILTIGATHGDEYEGPVAIKNLLREIETDEVVGRIILVPVLNVMAFKTGTRDTLEDGINLNRAFPGDSEGSITSRIADFVTRFLFPHVHVVLDIHSGGLVGRFAPFTEFHKVDNLEQRLLFEKTARGFGTQVVQLFQRETPGMLITQAHDLGKITVGTELGWGQSLFADGVSFARRGILYASVLHGQMEGKLPDDQPFRDEEQVLVDTTLPSCSVYAAYGGHFEPLIECGAFVETGQVLGKLHNFDLVDQPPRDVAAPHPGHVMFLALNAKVSQGQVLTQVSVPQEWSCHED
jgi:predicted deacylase